MLVSDLIIDVLYISRYACPGCIKKTSSNLMTREIEHLTNLLRKKE